LLAHVLGAGVALYDDDKRMHHASMSRGRWFSYPVDKAARAAEHRGRDQACVVEARINDRWTLLVRSRRGLHPDAEAIATWAAPKLAPYLPRHAEDEANYPPLGGGGSSGGSAELGIPVWWTRKIRN
jgi:hypothetical protein